MTGYEISVILYTIGSLNKRKAQISKNWKQRTNKRKYNQIYIVYALNILINERWEYNAQKEGFKKDLDTANLAGNTEAIKSIQEEYMEFNAAYEEAKNEILKDE